MKIIPAIDILGGRCVRLNQGKYNEVSEYDTDPVAVAKGFCDKGIDQLHVVDLDGARSGRIVNLDTIRNICAIPGLRIDFGGGVKSEAELEKALNMGVQQVNVGSLAASEPELFKSWLHTYGPDMLILSADCRDGHIATQGWTRQSGMDVVEFIRQFEDAGLKYVTCTDISRDGTLSGPSVALYQRLTENVQVQVIASGGVRRSSDIDELKLAGCTGVIIGKALYENTIALEEILESC